MTDAPLMTLNFTLPWPPSVNGYWALGLVGGKAKRARPTHFLSDRGRDYRLLAVDALNRQRVPRGAVKGRLAVTAVAYPPDRRARDLDNVWKGLLDALYHAGVIRDDADIDELSIRRAAVRAGGLIELRVSEISREMVPAELPLSMPVSPFVSRVVAAQLKQMDEQILAAALGDAPPF